MVAKEIIFQNRPRAEWKEVRRNEGEIYARGIFGIGSIKEGGGASVDVKEIVIRAEGEELLIHNTCHRYERMPRMRSAVVRQREEVILVFFLFLTARQFHSVVGT